VPAVIMSLPVMLRFLLLLLVLTQAVHGAGSYLFTGFKANGADGVYFAISDDGYRWELLNGGKPFVATDKPGELMRDPQLARGPNGDFHMVWTWSWNLPAVIGHASSPDLVQWSEHKMLDAMAKQPGVRNVWAPETYYEKDQKRWLIIWSSTVPKDASQAKIPNLRDHRIWALTTPDFETLSEPKVFFDPGFSVIDGTLLEANGKYRLIFKDEREEPLKKFIQYAVGPAMEGPWLDLSAPITEAWNEGPSALKVGDEYLIYFDHYRTPQHYGAIRSKDLIHWTDVTDKLTFPKGLRHGSFLAITDKEAERLRNR
jgi:sucrose-6-phosphate hydrolase SacC (GH32 family)